MNDNHDNEHDQHEQGYEQSFFPEKKHGLMERFRKLHEHARTNVPAEMAQKARNAFNVNPEAMADQPSVDGPVAVMIYPQNPFVGEPEIREMSQSEAHPGLVNARVRIRDEEYPIAKPDDNNNYLYWPGTPEFNQVNAFYYTTFTLRMYEKFASRSIPWAFTAPRLTVNPHVGVGMNAFYDEQNRMLGFFTFQASGEVVNTAQSADVVSHEAAHAVLDGMRDLYNESFGLGPLSFHESFGDMTAVLVALHDESLVKRLLDWTDGNLRTESFVSAVAEHIIESINKTNGGDTDVEHLNERTIYLRNAVNKFRGVPFDDIPYLPKDPAYELGRESHNYSRLFTGAFYDVLVSIYEHFIEEHEDMPRIAIHRAREVMGPLLTFAVEVAPVGELDFADMARAFLTADRLLYDGDYAAIIRQEFDKRRILTDAAALAHLDMLDALPDLLLPDHVDSALEAGIFLVEQVVPLLGLPDEDFTPMSAHRNRRGFAFLTYFSVRSITLSGPAYKQFDGSKVDAFGGLTLAFDPSGKLRSALYRPVTDEDVRQIQQMTLDLIEYGLVTESTLSGTGKVLSDEIVSVGVPSVQPRFLYLDEEQTRDQPPSSKLVRVPMILDAVPYQPADFVQYLQEWQQRLGKE